MSDRGDDSSTAPGRSFFGTVLTSISDGINDNLILARSGGFATIALLAAYGISQTPLFFRYRTVCDIPSKAFLTRKSIHGRIIKVQQPIDNNTEEPIVLYIRHLSPAERILSKSAFDFLIKYHPSSSFESFRRIPDDGNFHDGNLIRVQLAGVIHHTPKQITNATKSVQILYNNTESLYTSLNKYASNRVPVQCRLISRKVPTSVQDNNPLRKKTIPDLPDSRNHPIAVSNSNICDQTAVVIMLLKSRPLSLFDSTDIGESLIRLGLASVATTGLNSCCHPNERIADISDDVSDIRKDASYMARLGRAEFDACKGYYGIWSDEMYRASRNDIVDEVEFQQKAPIWRKIWRWIRGG